MSNTTIIHSIIPNNERMPPKKGSRTDHDVTDREPRAFEFRTVLRLRPLLKKEREDPILLDPLPSSDATTVVLHPPPPKQGDLMSPSSELVRQTIDPTTLALQDSDFRLDHVWPTETTQDKLYFSTGLPMALAAMEPLKADPQGAHQPSRVDHLIIGMGVSGSGKTYTCLGGGTIHNKRKKESDGLVPRILDSFFSQSKHHICNKRGLYFAVNLRILLVKQHKHKPDDGAIHDLLQPVAPRSFSISSVSSLSLASAAAKSPVIQNIKSVQTGPLMKHLSGSTTTKTNSSHYSSLDEPVFVEQDSEAEFHVVNGQVRACRTGEDAREALQVAMASAYRLSSKRHQSHVLVSMQPVLMDKQGTTVLRCGGTLAVLDMAGYTSLPTQTNNRAKESLPARFDAHAALLRCLRTIQENEGIRSGRNEDDVGKSPTPQSTFSRERRMSLRKIPFRQHKLTMLLQPILSNKISERTTVTLLLTAYPGHRDYMEKKALLNEVKGFRGSLLPFDAAAKTGLKVASRKKERSSKRKNANHNKPTHADMSSDADDEGSVKDTPKKVELSPMQVPTDYNAQNPVAVAPGISHYISSSYSDDPMDEYYRAEPLPPPVAPSYAMLMRASVSSSIMSPEPSAPVELHASAAPVISSEDLLTAADFPGVRFPPSPAVSVKSCTSGESVPPCPPALYQAPAPALQHRKTEHDETEELDRAVFSPMKALNKVVCASKKKGMQVIDKVSKLSYDKEYDHVALAQRLAHLEHEQNRVKKENIQLRDSNEKLKQENDQLRSRLQQYEDSNYHSDDNSHSKSEDWVTCHRDAATQNTLVDNSLLQHMAALGSYH